MAEARSRAGWVAPQLAAELPGLALRYAVADGGAGRSPREVRARLRELSDRFTGAGAVNLRHRDIPWAYRVFYRHIGLDPDDQPTPVEAVMLERMKRGGLPSRGLPADALTIATAETGIALHALDADRITGVAGVRPSEPGEGLAGRPGELPAGTLVLADERAPLGLLFGAIAPGIEVDRRSDRTLVCAIGVKGVPDIAVEEAIWLAVGLLGG